MNHSISPYGRLLGQYVRPLWRPVALMVVLLLAAIGIDLINPQLLRLFIDTAQHSAPQQALTQIALAFIGVALVGQAVHVGAASVSEQVGWRATNRLRADLLRHVLGLDLTFHKRNPPGALIERVDGDVTALANFFSQFVVQMVGNGLLVVGTLALLWNEDWRAGLGVSGYALVTLAVLGRVQRFGAGHWQAALQSEAELGGFLEERLRGSEDIRANGGEAYVLGQLDGILRRQLAILLRAFVARALISASTSGLFAVGYTVGLALGVWLYTHGNASIGTAFLITAYVGMLSKPLEAIRGQVEDFQQAAAGIVRVNQLLALRPSVREHAQAVLPAGPLGIAFEQVTFGYGDEDGEREQGTGNREQEADLSLFQPQALGLQPTTILHDVAFELPPGRVLGLLGRTGSGKTTLTRLLFRLYDPTAGTIRLGGVDLRDLALRDLRGRVGMVTQDVQIFAASVRANLALFDPAIGDEAIWHVLDTLGLRMLVERMPQGLDTRLGQGGVGLSAGQAQLVACARVFLHNPGLVILDEASSRLDPATEALLDRAIERLLNGRTGIIIAHRLGTVRRADDILVLDQGQIVEHGPRVALAADATSRFAALLRAGKDEVLA